MVFIAFFPLVVFAQGQAGDDQLVGPQQPADVAAEIQSIKDQLRLLSENLTKTVETVGEHETQIGQLKSDMMALTGQINEEIQKQQQILDAISQADSSGNYVPRLSSAMQSEDFRSEMKQAVNSSLGTNGDFRIANKTDQYQRILVNRQEYGISAGETLTLKVPTGTVTTQIPGRDITNWTLAGPKYEQNIEIVPPTEPVRTTVARPVYTPTTTTYMAPTTTYMVPTTTYSVPTTTYSVPTTTYSVPTTTYVAPPVYYDPFTVYYTPTYYWP
jgi:hypothetical protein